MRKLLVLLVLLPSMLLAQDSWVRVEVQPDNYPSETTWEIFNSAGEVIAVNPPFTDMSLQTTIIPLDSEDYNFVIYDEFGDGICCEFGEGWFGLSNDCGLNQYIYDFGGASATVFFTLEQCAQPPPPIIGCTDETALNFNPEADQNNYTGQVAASPCNPMYPSNYNYFGIDLTYYNENQSVFAIGTEISVGGYTYYIDGMGVPGNCNIGVALVYVVTDLALADGDLMNTMQVGALFTDLYPEDTWTINPCEYIYGCNNPSAINYDSLATADDGSCQVLSGCLDSTAVNYNPAASVEFPPGMSGPPPCEYFVLDTTTCGTDSVELIVSVVVDQYAGETSWYVQLSTGEVVIEVLEGDLSDVTMGTLVSQSTCVADNTNLTFRIFDSYGDGLGGAAWGGIDGTYLVHTACDTLASGGGNFGLNVMENGNTGDCDDLPIEGCMDNNYVEYNPEAVLDNGSCSTPNVYACIDVNSTNYDPSANTADQFANCSHTLNLTDGGENGWGGSFLIVAQGENYYGPFTVAPGEALFTTELDLNSNELVKAFFYSDPLSMNFMVECGFEIISPTGDIIALGGDNPFISPIKLSPYMYSGMGQCLSTCIPIVNGCMDDTACNYQPSANTPASCTFNVEYYDCNNHCVNDTDEDSVCDELEVEGCQDPLQYNFDSSATDPGECEPFIYGCTDNTMFNFNSDANTDNNSCIPIINGCTDPLAFNYDIEANVDNETCMPYAYGCTDITAFNYNVLANTDDNSCIPYLYGCTDDEALNFNVLANTDDNSCIPYLYGCMDFTMWNYNNLANTDDDTCIPYTYGCTDPTMFNYNAEANSDNDSCEPFAYGCTNEMAFNYNPAANAEYDPTNCEPFVYGCTDPDAFNYDSEANTEDFSCIATIYGCTEPSAFNYNTDANTDNGSCIDTIVGCTDQSAANYDEFVNTEDGSCLYDAGCYGGPGNPYYLNDECFAWVIDVDSYCCTTEWDASCISMYNYCQEGWPAGINDVSSLGIVIYPNPTRDVITIETHLDIQIQVYDMMGKLVIDVYKTPRLDLSKLPNGIYNMIILHEGVRYSKKVVKQ